MSKERYTCCESAFTISPPARRASSTAMPVFPDAVGPVMTVSRGFTRARMPQPLASASVLVALSAPRHGDRVALQQPPQLRAVHPEHAGCGSHVAAVLPQGLLDAGSLIGTDRPGAGGLVSWCS